LFFSDYGINEIIEKVPFVCTRIRGGHFFGFEIGVSAEKI